MSIVSKSERSRYLQQHYPVLFKLCVAGELPKILTYRCNTELPFCYGATERSSPIPAGWDSDSVKVIPLWENGSGLTAVRVTLGKAEFVQISYENPSDVEVLAKSIDGLLTYLLYFLVESAAGQEDDEFVEIQELASYLEFDKLALVVNLVKRQASDPDYESLFEVTRSM